LNANQENINNWEVDMKLKNQYKHSENQHRTLCKHLLKKWAKELKTEFKIFQKEQQKVKEKTVCKKFNELMMNVWVTFHDKLASLTYSMYEQKIVIHLFEKYITKNKKQ